MNSKDRILVIGESCRDIFHYGECNRLAPEAPAPVFNPVLTSENQGMAMNVQKNLQALGANCDIVTNSNWQSILKERYIHLNTNQMFLRVDNGDNDIERLQVKDLDLESYKTVVISDYCKGFLTKEDIEYISKNHDRVFLDTKKVLGTWTKHVDFIKINFNEYQRSKDFITTDIESKLIVTLGANGTKYRQKTFSVEKVEIKDTSGAGDTFLAGLVFHYNDTEDIESSITFANKCATKVVQKRGVNIV